MTCTIKLTNGMTAYIDDDMTWLRELTWTAFYNGQCRRLYAFNELNRRFLHQFVLHGVKMIDHKNHDGLDCRRSNLRPATYSLNSLNNEKLRRPGRQYRKDGSILYIAQIGFNNKQHFLGSFTTEAVASRVIQFNKRRLIEGKSIVRLTRSNSN